MFTHRDDTDEGWDFNAVLDATHDKPRGWSALISAISTTIWAVSYEKVVDAVLARVDHGDVDSVLDIFEDLDTLTTIAQPRPTWGSVVFKRACQNSDLEMVEALLRFLPPAIFDWTAGPNHPLVLALTAGMPGGRDKLSSIFKKRRAPGISAELVLLLCDKPGAVDSVTMKMLGECRFPWFWDESSDMVDARSRAMCALGRLVLMPFVNEAPVIEQLKAAIFSKLVTTCSREETDDETELALPSLLVEMGEAPGLEHEVKDMVVYYTTFPGVNKALLPFLKRVSESK